MMIESKNILFIQQSISISDGGVPRVSDIIYQELMARAYNCYFCFNGNDSKLYTADRKLKLSLKSFQKDRNELLDFVSNKKINVVVCQNAYSDYYIRLISEIKRKNKNLVLFVFLHAAPDYWLNYNLKDDIHFGKPAIKEKIKNRLKALIYPFYNPYVRQTSKLYQLCDSFFVLSESFKDSFRKIYLKNKNHNKLLSLANPTTYPFYATKDTICTKEKIVLIVSRLKEDQKKISLALKAWANLSNEVRSGWQMVVVGSGPDEASYKKFVNEQHIEHVLFAGHKNEVLEYYQRASIFLMTSVWEGLPMSLLEAQQNGVVPVVFNSFSAVRDIVENGKTGFIIAQNNLNAFSNAMSCLITNTDMRTRMALDAIESSKRFNIQNIADKWEEYLNAN